MADKVSHNALVVVADGTGARFFRNAGHGSKVRLHLKASLSPIL
jgi:protein required for attachment to host cells